MDYKHLVQGECYFLGNNQARQYEYLTKDIDCEVAIIGGGVTGAILGHYFTKKNVDTVILEKERIAHGSSSITTSLLQYELDENADALMEMLSANDIALAYELGLFALEELRDIIKAYGNKCYYKKVDCLLYSAKKDRVKQIVKEYEFRKSHGFDVSLLDEGNKDFDIDFEMALLSRGGGAVLNPFLFAHMLIDESRDRGLRVYENSEVIKIDYDSNNEGATVECSYGKKVRCKKVILASGYNTESFINRNFGTKYITYNLVSEALNVGERFAGTIFRDDNDPYHYFRTTHDGRVIFGGEDNLYVDDIEMEKLSERYYDKLETTMKSVLKKYHLSVKYRCLGAFTTTKDNLGFIGVSPEHKNLWLCLGYGANGILFSMLGGYFLSELYIGNEHRGMNLFKIDRFDK